MGERNIQNRKIRGDTRLIYWLSWSGWTLIKARMDPGISTSARTISVIHDLYEIMILKNWNQSL